MGDEDNKCASEKGAPVLEPRRAILGGVILTLGLGLILLLGVIFWPGSRPNSVQPAPAQNADTMRTTAQHRLSARSGETTGSPTAPANAPAGGGITAYPGGLSATQWNALPPHLQKRTESLISYSVGQLDRIGQNPGRPLQDLEAVHEILHNYQITVKSRRGLPIGTHEETVATLRGNNPWGLPFLPADHPNLTADNQLLDRWQTPFFFHALAADQVQIRSAGPDKEMWTDDDLTYPPDDAGTP